MKDSNNYDAIARIYDRLGKMVFGNALSVSQLEYLEEVPCSGKVLIIGGGSGKIIGPVMEKMQPSVLVYIEKSGPMVALSRKNTPEQFKDQVVFIHGTENDLTEEEKFDAVITNFFFDQFEYRTIARIFLKLERVLKTGGYWVWTDFVPPRRRYHRILLKMMFFFFSITTSLATRHIFNLYPTFQKKGLQLVKKASFFGGFIETAVFRKP